MNHLSPKLAPLLVLLVYLSAGAQDSEPTPTLAISEPIVCSEIRGFGDFDRLEPPVLSADQKLQTYLQPTGHTINHDSKTDLHSAHLVVDVVLRRKGQKTPIARKDKILDYKPRASSPPTNLYLGTTLSLKGLRPGDYELDLLVKDQLAPANPKPSASRTVAFKIKPTS
jgi:hypothetical protein